MIAMRRATLATLLLAIPVGGAAARAQDSGQRLPAATLRADLDAMGKDFLGRDRSYAPEARAEAERRITLLAGAADTASRAWFEVEVARIAALADNGHTGSSASVRSTHFNRVGIRLAPFGDDFFVLYADTAVADLLGARLVGVDERSIAELRTAGRTLAGGTDARRDRSVPFLLESPEQLRALGLVAQPGAATYRFERADGARVERRLVAEPADAARSRAGASRWMYPDLATTPPTRWRTLLPASRAPWALQDVATPFRWRDAPEIHGVVIELRQNVDAAGQSIGDFLEQMEKLLRDKHPQHVVLDMRMNGGGNLGTTRDFAQRLPTLVTGRVFVLTSPYTFSAAISTVGYLKQAAPDRVTIVGEMVGDRLIFWAEGGPVALPGTGAMLGVAKERHDYNTGCRPYKDCHGPVARNPIAVPTLAPDISAPWTIADYRAGRDPAMSAVLAAIK
jgi:hypothetical protein